MALMEVKDLSVTLTRGGTEKPLVREVSYTLEKGDTLAIVGESGSGKSVSSMAILGLLPTELRVAADRIAFDGQDLLGLRGEAIRRVRGREIGMVFQEPMTALNPVRRIGSQLGDAIRVNLGLSRRAARDRAVELLTEVGLSEAERRLDQYPHNLSGGMRQRVMIALALSGEPKLIIADEPTTALDVTIQAQILDLMARLCRDHGTALILITHNLGIVARYAQRVHVMYAGRVVETGTAAEIYHRPRHPYTAGLLASVPRLDGDRGRDLASIGGSPADPFAPIEGCRFHPRCDRRGEPCRRSPPPLERGVACYFPAGEDERIAS